MLVNRLTKYNNIIIYRGKSSLYTACGVEPLLVETPMTQEEKESIGDIGTCFMRATGTKINVNTIDQPMRDVINDAINASTNNGKTIIIVATISFNGATVYLYECCRSQGDVQRFKKAVNDAGFKNAKGRMKSTYDYDAAIILVEQLDELVVRENLSAGVIGFNSIKVDPILAGYIDM